jgi:serine protease inhibitor
VATNRMSFPYSRQLRPILAYRHPDNTFGGPDFMKKNFALVTLCLFAFSSLSLAGAEDCGPRLAAFNQAYNPFSQDLAAKVSDSSPGQNSMVSAPSVRMALSLAALGSRGQTWAEFSKVLRFGDSSQPADVAEVIPQSVSALSYQSDDGPVVKVVNGLFARNGFQLTPEFKSLIEQTGAKIANVDFNDPATLKAINNWVSDNTNGKITEIVKKLKPLDFLVLLNATYFKGLWTYQFSQGLTAPRDFTQLDGTTKPVPMMSLGSPKSLRYYEDATAQVVGLPYRGPSKDFGNTRYTMYVLLPKGGQGASLQEVSSNNYIQNAISSAKVLNGAVTIPKFKYEGDYNLIPILQQMGLVTPFDAGDFSGMAKTTQPIYISQVRHKTFIEVMETGTEAAAATSVTVTTRSISLPKPPAFQFVADKPFIFVIRDESTGVSLFQGTVVSP